MEIRNNIIFSIMVHVMAISSVAIIGSMVRDTKLRIPDHITVSLFEEEMVISSVVVSKNTKRNKSEPDNETYISQRDTKGNKNVIPAKIGLQKDMDSRLSPQAIRRGERIAGMTEKKEFSDENNISTHISIGQHPYVTQGSTQIFIVQDKGTSGENSSAQNTTSHIASKNLIDRDSPSSQYSLIRAAIEKVKTYPFIARKKKIEGTVITEFSINNKGYPQDIAVRKSSGYEVLDSTAINIIKKAAPFPQIDGHILIPITFSLRDAAQSQ